MRIIPVQQRTPEWLALKAGKFSGTRFNALMAKIAGGKPAASRKNLIVQLAVERMTGVLEDSYQNDAMRRGIELEDEARAAYEAYAGELVEEVGFALHDDRDNVGVSLDGLVGDLGIVELKCPASMAKHADALQTGAHAEEYWWQIVGQLWVSGREWCDAVSYDPRFPEGLRLAVKRVHRDNNDMAALATAVTQAEAEVCAYIEAFNSLRKAA